MAHDPLSPLASPTHPAPPGFRARADRTRLTAATVPVLIATVSAAGLAGALGAVGHKAGAPARSPARAAGTMLPYRSLALGEAALGPGMAAQAAHREAAAAEAPKGNALALPPGAAAGQAAKVEETGAVTLVVPVTRIQDDVTRLSAVAVAYGGYIAGTTTSSEEPGSPAQGLVTMEVPQPDFGNVLAQVKALGKVVALTTSATDVTGQYVDLQAQIAALVASRRQYLTIMAKATTIGAVLAVQSQLDNLQGQLDEVQGQLKVLSHETTYATLAVTLSQRVTPPAVTKPPGGFARAWRAAVNGFVAGWEGVVRVAGPLAFALLLLASLAFGGRLAWRLSRRPASEKS
jgi:hypothetical protein